MFGELRSALNRRAKRGRAGEGTRPYMFSGSRIIPPRSSAPQRERPRPPQLSIA